MDVKFFGTDTKHDEFVLDFNLVRAVVVAAAVAAVVAVGPNVLKIVFNRSKTLKVLYPTNKPLKRFILGLDFFPFKKLTLFASLDFEQRMLIPINKCVCVRAYMLVRVLGCVHTLCVRLLSQAMCEHEPMCIISNKGRLKSPPHQLKLFSGPKIS